MWFSRCGGLTGSTDAHRTPSTDLLAALSLGNDFIYLAAIQSPSGMGCLELRSFFWLCSGHGVNPAGVFSDSRLMHRVKGSSPGCQHCPRLPVGRSSRVKVVGTQNNKGNSLRT